MAHKVHKYPFPEPGAERTCPDCEGKKFVKKDGKEFDCITCNMQGFQIFECPCLYGQEYACPFRKERA